MARLWPKSRTLPLMVFLTALVAVSGPFCAVCRAQQAYGKKQSWTDPITTPLKDGFDKLGQTINPTPSPPKMLEDNAVALKGKGKPSARLYVAIARLYEQSGKLTEAEQQYQLALKDEPDDLAALTGYAHHKERFGHSDEAIQLYQRAVKAHPQQASAHNNLGLCYSRQNRLNEAAASIAHAIQFEPKNPLYRNNMATVLVDQGNVREAYRHLRAVHSDAATYYNLGYLLNKKGQTQAAKQHFAMALRADPSMNAARRWFEYLQKSEGQARVPQRPAAGGPVASQTYAAPPPSEPTPQRLPATQQRFVGSEGPGLPGISYEGSVAPPTAPLPPPSTNAALRPLPRVN